MSEDPAFAKQCLFDAIDRLSIRDDTSEVFTELANYLDAIGEDVRALVVRRSDPTIDTSILNEEISEHFMVEDISQLTEREWVALPEGLDSEKAEELLTAYHAALD